MNELTLKLKSGRLIIGFAPMHFMLAEQHNIDFEDIIDVGFVTNNRVVWCNRKIHTTDSNR